MNTIDLYSAQGQLAWAAYAALQIGPISRDRLTEHPAVAMPDALAETLASRYTVQAIHNDPLAGAYAVLFRDADGKQTLAVRGTESAADYAADLHFLTGIPAWMNLQYKSLVGAVETWAAQGLLSSPTTLTGHSLGGYVLTQRFLHRSGCQGISLSGGLHVQRLVRAFGLQVYSWRLQNQIALDKKTCSTA